MLRTDNIKSPQFSETKAMGMAYKTCWMRCPSKGDYTKQPHPGYLSKRKVDSSCAQGKLERGRYEKFDAWTIVSRKSCIHPG